MRSVNTLTRPPNITVNNHGHRIPAFLQQEPCLQEDPPLSLRPPRHCLVSRHRQPEENIMDTCRRMLRSRVGSVLVPPLARRYEQ